MKRKNNLDEMQEQKLLHIESKGYWLAFWGLGVSLIIQLIFYGPTNDWRYMAAEWIVFMAIALYMVAGCIKEGIWDRKLRPSFKDNIFIIFYSSNSFNNITCLFFKIAAEIVNALKHKIITINPEKKPATLVKRTIYSLFE